MSTPPNMLSPKDCSYISDIMQTILVLTKNIEEESQCIEDKDIKTHFKTAVATLSKQYSSLLALLEGGKSNA